VTTAGPPLPPRRVVLVGMMGTGKSTVGRALAERTGWPFLDNDELVRRRTGRSARELQGESLDALRDAEAAALLDGLAEPVPTIVGAAAGVIERAELRAALRDGATVVWLRADPAVLARRALPDLHAAKGDHRPWLTGGEASARAWLRARDTERRPHYEAVADVVVDVDLPGGSDRPVHAIAEAIIDALAAAGRDPG